MEQVNKCSSPNTEKLAPSNLRSPLPFPHVLIVSPEQEVLEDGTSAEVERVRQSERYRIMKVCPCLGVALGSQLGLGNVCWNSKQMSC